MLANISYNGKGIAEGHEIELLIFKYRTNEQ